MNSRFHIAATLLLLLAATCAKADNIDDTLNKNEKYQQGIRALTQNKHEVADKLLVSVSEQELTRPSLLRVKTRIAEARVRGKRYAGALELFSEPGLATDPQANYWQALALIGTGRAGDAEKILSEITPSSTNPYWAEATLTRTSLLQRYGDAEGAFRILTPLIESGSEPNASRARLRAAEIRLGQKQWDEVAPLLTDLDSSEKLPALQLQYLRARLDLGQGKWKESLSKFKALNTPENLASLPSDIHDGIVIGLATALRGNGDTEEAIDLLKYFIDTSPQSSNLTIAFETLYELGAFGRLYEKLNAWANSTPEQPLAGVATYFLAVTQATAVDEDTAVETLKSFQTVFADHPIAERALLHLCEIYVGRANKPRALEVLGVLEEISETQAVLDRVKYIEARANFAAREFKLAADKFTDAATLNNPAAKVATFNSAIAMLKANDLKGFQQRQQMLGDLGEVEYGSDLVLERALYAARQGAPDAVQTLDDFLSKYPDHKRRAEAHLALAYLHLLTPKIVSAHNHLEEARKAPPVPQFDEEAGYIAFWIEHVSFLHEPNEKNKKSVIASGDLFVQNYPESSRAPEILFKLGGMLFRNGSFTEAQTRFEKLALDYPTSPRAEVSLFTAGRAAMRTGAKTSLETAFRIFARVEALGGQFALTARLQRAHVRRVQMEEKEAIEILDSILAEKPEGEMLFTTLTMKGEAHFLLSSKKKSDDEEETKRTEEDKAAEELQRKLAQLELAISAYRRVADNTEASTYWLNQSLTRIGNCLESAGRPDEALLAYDRVINRPKATLKENEIEDYVWYYKAGFSAIHIYEERENWQAAINIADTLAEKDGPNAQIARERSEQLATKNFIWRE